MKWLYRMVSEVDGVPECQCTVCKGTIRDDTAYSPNGLDDPEVVSASSTSCGDEADLMTAEQEEWIAKIWGVDPYTDFVVCESCVNGYCGAVEGDTADVWLDKQIEAYTKRAEDGLRAATEQSTDMPPQLFIITGVSAVGKTEVLEKLRELLPSELFDCHDIDENGVPDGVTVEWRLSRVEQMLQVAKANATDGRSTVLSGTVRLGDVEARAACSTAPSVRYCLLEASSTVMAERLDRRFSTEGQRANAQRVTGMTTKEFVQRMSPFRDSVRAEFEASPCDWTTFDTSDVTLDDSVAFVVNWLNGSVNDEQ
jgi:hypothetical protein